MNMETMRPQSQWSRGQPKHRRVRESLRKQIVAGQYLPGQRLPTEMEMARVERVGRQTILRALQDLVQEGLIVRRRGSGSYVADRKSPPPIPGRILRLGLLCKDTLQPNDRWSNFQGAIVRGALRGWGLEGVAPEVPEVNERQATRAIWTSPDRALTLVCLGESRFSQVRHPPLDLVIEGKFDGLVTASIIEEPWLDELLGLGLPVVLTDLFKERFSLLADQVFVDPLAGYRAAVRHFAERGLRRIHFVMGYMSIPAPSVEMSREEVAAFRGKQKRVDPDSYLRLGAYRQAMDEASLRVEHGWIHFSNPLEENDQQLAERLLKLPESERPQALLCHEVQQVDALRAAFAERGASIIGAGAADSDYRGAALPIHVDGTKLGAVAAELLISRLQRPSRTPLCVGIPMAFGGESPMAAALTDPVFLALRGV